VLMRKVTGNKPLRHHGEVSQAAALPAPGHAD
jgi:hypothetical protein